MKNLGQMMKQAQELQQKISDMQAALAKKHITGTAGGGLVTVTLNGKGEMAKIKLDPSLIRPEENEILEDLVVAAHADAKAKLETFLAEEMSKLTGGIPLPPGFSLPF